jgi:hypothetical protein
VKDAALERVTVAAGRDDGAERDNDEEKGEAAQHACPKE